MKLGAVLMASGAGKRFGANKLLWPVDGVPLIERAMEAVPIGLFHRAVVVSGYPRILELAAEKGYAAIENPEPKRGQSVSVVLGTRELLDTDGILFAVCDQPWLKSESVKRLLSAFMAQPEYIRALGWQGRKGNPVVFPPSTFPALLGLTGDRGGGAVIRANPGLLRLTDAGGPRELQDVDFPEDLEKYEERQ